MKDNEMEGLSESGRLKFSRSATKRSQPKEIG